MLPSDLVSSADVFPLPSWFLFNNLYISNLGDGVLLIVIHFAITMHEPTLMDTFTIIKGREREDLGYIRVHIRASEFFK